MPSPWDSSIPCGQSRARQSPLTPAAACLRARSSNCPSTRLRSDGRSPESPLESCMPAPRLYLDNAATSFPKPPCVHEAMVHYMTQVGGTAGRGTYAEACEGARVIATCRRRICDFIHGESPDHVVFALNTSDALNLAIGGIVSQRRIDSPSRPIHLVTTALDHNSVLRPYTAHADIGVEWTCVSLDPVSGVVDPDQIKAAIRSDTCLLYTS